MKTKVFILSLLMVIVMFFNAYGDDKFHETKIDGKLQGPTNKEKRKASSDDSGAIFIYLHFSGPSWHYMYPRTDLLIEDQEGLKTGYDPIAGVYYDQIPKSSYYSNGVYDPTTGESRETSKKIEIMQPSAGDYKLYVIGTDAGTYGLDLYVYDPELNPSGTSVKDVPITEHEIHAYSFYYPKTIGADISIGYDGGGQRPSDVNKFLSYIRPSERQTTLHPGTTTYNMMIRYGDTIITSTFNAELNGMDITSLFNPAPGGTEAVTLNLSQGRNTLVLSVDANLTNRIAGDKDRLVFIVP